LNTELRYSFGIINWHQGEVQKLNRKTRKNSNHPWTASFDILYVPRKGGGRGLMQMEEAYIAGVIKLEEYVDHTQDAVMQIVRIHQCNTNSTVFQKPTNLNKSFQTDTKQITNPEHEGKVGSKKAARTIST
jgi:hypothetical protein